MGDSETNEEELSRQPSYLGALSWCRPILWFLLCPRKDYLVQSGQECLPLLTTRSCPRYYSRVKTVIRYQSINSRKKKGKKKRKRQEDSVNTCFHLACESLEMGDWLLLLIRESRFSSRSSREQFNLAQPIVVIQRVKPNSRCVKGTYQFSIGIGSFT